MISTRTERICYLAGIVDGEGSIDVSVAKVEGTRKTPSHRVRLKVSMCENESIELLEHCFGGLAKLRHRKNPKHKPIWEWCIRSLNARAALVELFPYLLIKKEQAKIAIGLSGRLASRKYYPQKGEKGIKRTPNEEIKIRTQLANRLKELNAKGIKRKANFVVAPSRAADRSPKKD